MSGWERDKIGKLADQMKPNELQLIDKLNDILDDGFYAESFEGPEGLFDKKDCQILRMDRHGELLPHKTIELEIGANQKDWDSELPTEKRWPRGLSLLTRKNPDNYDFFLKVSKTFKSGFLIDSQWFKMALEAGLIKAEKREHNLGMKTCDVFYEIPWTLAKESYPAVILIENDNWAEFIKALK